MEERYKAILALVKNTAKGNRFKEDLERLLPLIENGSLDMEIKNRLLVELYRFLVYSGTEVSIDPRGDTRMKLDILFDIRDAIQSGVVDDGILEKTAARISLMRDNIDNPFKIIDERSAFFKKYPDAMF